MTSKLPCWGIPRFVTHLCKNVLMNTEFHTMLSHTAREFNPWKIARISCGVFFFTTHRFGWFSSWFNITWLTVIWNLGWCLGGSPKDICGLVRSQKKNIEPRSVNVWYGFVWICGRPKSQDWSSFFQMGHIGYTMVYQYIPFSDVINCITILQVPWSPTLPIEKPATACALRPKTPNYQPCAPHGVHHRLNQLSQRSDEFHDLRPKLGSHGDFTSI
jgi:hypothetical protein